MNVEDALTFDTPTTMQQRPDIPLYCTVADKLMPDEVCVVRGRDKILGNGACHVMPDLAALVRKDRVVWREQECCKRVEGHLACGWNVREVIAGGGVRGNVDTCVFSEHDT